MSEPLRVGLGTFLTMYGPFRGEIHVVQRVSRQKGARGANRRKGTESRPSLAGPGDGSGLTDGGSAITSDARSSGRTPNAGPADGQGEEPKRAPIPGGGSPEEPGTATEKTVRPLQPMKEMPGTKWGLTKAVNEEEQIVPVIGGLLKSQDEKVRLRMIELLMEAAYSENSGREEVDRSSFRGWNLPRPKKD